MNWTSESPEQMYMFSLYPTVVPSNEFFSLIFVVQKFPVLFVKLWFFSSHSKYLRTMAVSSECLEVKVALSKLPDKEWVLRFLLGFFSFQSCPVHSILRFNRPFSRVQSRPEWRRSRSETTQSSSSGTVRRSVPSAPSAPTTAHLWSKECTRTDGFDVRGTVLASTWKQVRHTSLVWPLAYEHEVERSF